MTFSPDEVAYINSQHLARIATVSGDGQPDVTAVVFDFDGSTFTIGGFNPTNTRRTRNVRNGNDKVALIIDDLKTIKPWTPRFIRIYGAAELLDRDGQQILQITPTTSWSMNLGGEWSPGGTADHPTTRKTEH